MSFYNTKIRRIYERAGFNLKDNAILDTIYLVLLSSLAGWEDYNPAGLNTLPALLKRRSIANFGMNKSSKTNSIKSGVQGTAVILAEIKSDCSLETVSKSAVQTDSDGGKYSLKLIMNGISDLVVITNNNSSQRMAVVLSIFNFNSILAFYFERSAAYMRSTITSYAVLAKIETMGVLC